VTGEVDRRSKRLQPPCPEDSVVTVELQLSTHFSKDKTIKLKMQPAEQDVQSLKGKMASIEITYQLQRVVLMAACCLNSQNTDTQKRGLEVLDLIDTVERYVSVLQHDQAVAMT